MTHAHEATSTYTCKFGTCTNEVKSSRGMYSYCDDHRGRAPRSAPTKSSVASETSALLKMAKAVDRAKDKATAKTTEALTLKRKADELERQFKERLRAMTEVDE